MIEREIVIRCAGYGSTGPRWRTTFDGMLLGVFRCPLYDGARALLAGEFASPDDRLNLRHEGSPIVAISGTVGRLAGWTVSDAERRGDPSLRRWHSRNPEGSDQ